MSVRAFPSFSSSPRSTLQLRERLPRTTPTSSVFACETILLAGQPSRLEGHGRRGSSGLFFEPRFRGDGVVMLAEDGLNSLGRFRGAPCGFAENRGDCFSGVPKLLRPDANSVQLTIRRLVSGVADSAAERLPPNRDQSRQCVGGAGVRVHHRVGVDEGRRPCRSVQTIEKPEVSIAVQHDGQVSFRRGALTGQDLAELVRGVLERGSQHIGVSKRPQSRSDPLEVASNMG
jgi:hypothetical protein